MYPKRPSHSLTYTFLTNKIYYLKIFSDMKTKLLTLTPMLMVFGASLYAQSSSFAYTFGKHQDDYSYAVMETSDGHFVMVGGALLGGGGKTDGTIIKLTNTGTLVWYRTYGGNNRDLLRFPFESSDGNYIIFGSTELGGMITFNRPIAIKVSPSGALLETRSYNIVGRFLGVKKISGDFVAVGYDDINRKGFLAFLTSDANMRFIKYYSEGSLYDLAPDGSGGYILVGEKNGDGWILRVDDSGNVLWSRIYGSSDEDRLKSVIVVPPYAYVGGETRSSGAGNKDVWIMKIDITDGDIVFSKTYGGTNEENIVSLMLNGTTIGVLAGTKSFGLGNEDFWFFEIDFNGNLLSSYTFGGGGEDKPQMGKTTSDGGYVLVGFTNTNSFSMGRGRDHFIVKISAGRYSCVESGRPIPTILPYIPSISDITESPLRDTLTFVSPNFTTTSPDIDYTVVCSPLGGDDELSIYEGFKGLYSINSKDGYITIRAYGFNISIYTVDGRLLINGKDYLEARLPKGIYKAIIGKNHHTLIIR